MKIYYIANIRLPTEKAHGIQTMKMCETLSAQAEITLIVPRRLNPIKINPFVFYGVEPRFKIVKVPCLDLVTFGFGKIGFWLEAFLFLFTSRLHLFFKPKGLIYSRDFITGLFFPELVIEAHYFPKKLSYFFRVVLKKAKKWIVLTNFLKKKLIEAGVSAEKILVAPDAVDIKKFDITLSKEECRDKLNLPKDKKLVMYTGHFYEWKGVDTLIAATKYLDDSYVLYLVGGTPRDIVKYKEKVVGNKKIEILGHRPYSEMPLWLKAADTLVLQNIATEDISQFYTSPMKMFEYMASKRPIIASDLPSLKEVLNEKNAFFVKPGDVEGLAAAIKFVVQNLSITKIKTQIAYENVKQYTWEKRAGSILSFLS